VSVFSLKNQKEFDFVNQHGSKKHGSCFIIVLSSNVSSLHPPSDNTTFLGLKVSRKYSKKAVIRNKAKRRIKHILQNLVQDPSIDLKQKAFIVIPKIGLDKADFSNLKKDFKRVVLQIMQRPN
jgi:ribonuclease P protein component